MGRFETGKTHLEGRGGLLGGHCDTFSSVAVD